MYTQAGDTVTLRKNEGKAYPVAGVALSETKCGGGRFKGDQTYAQEYTYVRGAMGDLGPRSLTDLRFFGPFQEGEVLTGEVDNANVAEERIMALLFTYGRMGHAYPRTLEEVMRYSGINPTRVFARQFSITIANVITSGDPGTAFMTASQEDLWLSADSQYYVLGAIPHLVASEMLLQFYGQVPKHHKDHHNAVLPLGTGADEVRFCASEVCLPYEAIGPFDGDSLPTIGGFGIDATAVTFGLILGEIEGGA